jgi:hypothetical protein
MPAGLNGWTLIGAVIGVGTGAALGFDSRGWLIFVAITLLVWLLIFAAIRVRANRS